jgi:lysophospholipase L1-like esterase
VVVFGDSLAYGATDEAHGALGDFAVSWNAWGETTWDQYTGAARSVVPSGAGVAVVALGTNDLWDGWQPTDQAKLDRFLMALGFPPCTVLVSFASGGPVLDIFHTPNPKYPPAEQSANEALAAAAKKRTAAGAPTVVADWGAAAAAAPGTYSWDNVHHTDAGDRTWADWLHAELTRVTSGPCRSAG